MNVGWWGVAMLGALCVAFCAFPTGESPPWQPLWRHALGFAALAFGAAVGLMLAVAGATS